MRAKYLAWRKPTTIRPPSYANKSSIATGAASRLLKPYCSTMATCAPASSDATLIRCSTDQLLPGGPAWYGPGPAVAARVAGECDHSPKTRPFVTRLSPHLPLCSYAGPPRSSGHRGILQPQRSFYETVAREFPVWVLAKQARSRSLDHNSAYFIASSRRHLPH